MDLHDVSCMQIFASGIVSFSLEHHLTCCVGCTGQRNAHEQPVVKEVEGGAPASYDESCQQREELTDKVRRAHKEMLKPETDVQSEELDQWHDAPDA